MALSLFHEDSMDAECRSPGTTFDLLGPSSQGRAATTTELQILQILKRVEDLDELIGKSLSEDFSPRTNPLNDQHFDSVLGEPLPKGFLLSIVIPVYNEERTLSQVLSRVEALPVPKEIVIVDDCSTDGTIDILREQEKRGVHEIVYQPINQGKGAALRTGFRRTKGDIVVVQDADLEYNPQDILPMLLPLLRGEADVVYGSRFLENKHQDPSWLHRFGNAVLTKASNYLTGLQLTDMETCYKAFRREVIAGIEIQQNRFGFEPEITARLARQNRKFVEVPIGYWARSYAEGKKIGWKDLVSTLYCIVRYGMLAE